MKHHQHKDLLVISIILFLVMGIATLFNTSSLNNITGAVVGVESIEEVQIQEEVLATLAQQDTAAVIIVLKENTQTASADLEIRQEAIAATQESVLDNLNLEETKTIFGVQETEFTVDEKFASVNAFAGEVTAAGLEELRSSPHVEAVIPNGVKTLFLAQSVPLIQASTVWNITLNGQNIDGTGQTVCVVDTGVDYTHNSFGNCDTASFLAGTCSKIIAGYDFAYDDNDPYDDHGHGTHVAGIIASQDSVYRGVAPGAKIAAVKVCNNGGSCADADVLAGIDWCVSHAQEYNISVISMSLGGDQYSSYCDNSSVEAPLYATAINQAALQNISMVVATGNGLSNIAAGIALPACIENAVRVSATTKSDQMASYAFRNSNFSDTLLAPGSSITSLRPGDTTMTLSGTSMAAPHVAAAAALLQQFSLLQTGYFLTPQQVEEQLIATGVIIDDSAGSGISYSRINPYQTLLSLDTLAPVITFTSPTPLASSENTGIVIINITSNELLQSAILNWNGVNQTMNGSGTSFQMVKDLLSSGNYSFTVYGIDLANKTGETELRTITFTIIPTIILVTPVNNSYKNTAFRINASVSDDNLLSSVTFLVVNSSGTLFFNDTSLVAESTQQRNDVINISSSEFIDGVYTVIITATNADGGTKTASTSFIIDKTTPLITEINKTPELMYNNNSALFSIKVQDDWLNTSLVFLETNASGNWTSYPMGLEQGNRFNFTLRGKNNLSIGKHIGYRFSAADFAGNQYLTEGFYFTVENRLPIVTINSPLANAVLEIGDSVAFNAQADDADDDILSYSWNYGFGDNASGQNQSYVYNSTGSFTVQMTVTDSLNQSSTTIPITVTDTAAPVISLSSYDTEIHLEQDTNLVVTATASDPSGISIFNLTVAGVLQSSSCSSTNISKSCNWIVNNLSLGSYSFVLNSTDTVAHRNSSVHTFTVTSCSDNLQNGNEQGIDCGGACGLACSSSTSSDTGSSSSASGDSSSSSSTSPSEEIILEDTGAENIAEVPVELVEEPTEFPIDGTALLEIDPSSTEIGVEETVVGDETNFFSKGITGFFTALLPNTGNSKVYGLIGMLVLITVLGTIYLVLGRKK